MSDEIILPPDEIMRQMSNMAMELATDYFSKMAEDLAKNLPSDVSGKDALIAFANAIRSINDEVYPKDRTKQ